MTGVTSVAGTAYPFERQEFYPEYILVRVARVLEFCVVLCAHLVNMLACVVVSK